MFDPRQRPQMPQQQQGSWMQNSPWLQQLAQRYQAMQQGGQGRMGVGPNGPPPGQPGMGPGMAPPPQGMPPQGMPPQAAPQGAPGAFGGNPALMQQLAQQHGQMPPQAAPNPAAMGRPQQGFAMPTGQRGPGDNDQDPNARRF